LNCLIGLMSGGREGRGGKGEKNKERKKKKRFQYILTNPHSVCSPTEKEKKGKEDNQRTEVT